MAEIPYHEAAAHEATALPVMLPGKLVGRDQVLASIYGELKQNKPVWVYGAPGIGKTALAATLASAYTQQAGGALWLNVDDDSLSSLVVRVGRAYGDMDIANRENPLGMVGAAAALLTQHRPLVVLDGSPLLPAVSEFVDKMASGLPVMIVGGEPGDGAWTNVPLPTLAESDGITLFSEKSGINTPEVRQVAALLGYEPFALLIAAGTARVAKLDAAGLLAALNAINADTPANRALQLGFVRLPQALQGILLMLGATFNGSASLEMLHMLSSAPAETVQKVLTILTAAGFVQQDKRYGSPFYSLHPLAHAYAQQFLASGGRLKPLQEKVRDTVLAYASQHTGTSPADHDALAVEMDTFLATAHWATEQGEMDVASQIVVALTQAGDFVKERGYLYELLQLREVGSSTASPFPANTVTSTAFMDALTSDDEYDEYNEYDIDEDALEPADEDDDEAGKATTPLGAPENIFSPPAPVVDPTSVEGLRAAIANARGEGDNARVIELQKQLAARLHHEGSDNEAIALYNDVLVAYEEQGNQPQTLVTLERLTRILLEQDSAQAAEMHARRGVNLAKEMQDTAAQPRLLALLGDAQQQLGEGGGAAASYTEALDIVRAQGNAEAEAETMLKLGFAQLDSDDANAAIQTWNDALERCRALGKRDCEGRILGGLGTAHGELARWEEALNYHTSALYIAREVGDKTEEALQLGSLGYAAKQAKRLPQSVIHYRQALHLAYQGGETENIVSALVDLVRLLLASPQHLSIAELLIDDALMHDSNDREVLKLKERVGSEKLMAGAQGTAFKPVEGSAGDYAANAYQLLSA